MVGHGVARHGAAGAAGGARLGVAWEAWRGGVRQAMTGAELKALRKSLGLSLAEAAKQVEVSVRTWARWETSDEVPPGAVKLFKIVNKLEKP